ncbi:hypothetical protein GALMADRAFT_143873 [Galerina marginata CBS 339.88]|uniref:Prolyl 4-hydroxylase alpha subunit domain-containing protein n=1 Tax=Galerina marginata (strain CBS 339.88) TaxID=685588 RepID=A0A067SKZ5_GALM3|nr:hypothetical protein GALMADRAFT_143873 [Galerina marginata CBS 339.88]
MAATLFDFSNTALKKDYKGYYVKVIDNVFTPEECDELIALAESDQKWKVAAVNYGPGRYDNYVDTDYRNSQRILLFDQKAADKIQERILPLVPELVKIEPGDEWETIVAARGRLRKTWELAGVNERLSFLRYEKGNYFRPHCDGPLRLPDGRQAGVTLQVYLGDEGVKGGATRILGSKDKYVDIEPKKGRVLIFQQRGLYHSGEDVIKGVKYTLRSDFMYHVKNPDTSD